MPSMVEVDEIHEKTADSGVSIKNDLKLSSGNAIKNASGVALLTEAGALGGSVVGGQAGTGAFAARDTGTSWVALADSALLSFDNASTGDSFDTDGNYTTGSSSYTAPGTGVYLFWFSIYTAQSDASNGFNFWKDGAELNLQHDGANRLTYVSTSGTDDFTIQATIVIDLSTDEEIDIRASTETDYYPAYSQWGGVRLR